MTFVCFSIDKSYFLLKTGFLIFNIALIAFWADFISRDVSTSIIEPRLSENRRKRLQELEKQLTDYKKKMTELQKFEKLKVQNDLSLNKMREEVLALKQQKVQLVKQSRIESQKFVEWKLKAEKQMNQMKAMVKYDIF